jgi:GTP cyclohydrolase I
MKISKDQAKEAVRMLLYYIGEDPNREGLLDTPNRFVKAWDEWFQGYKQKPEEVLSTYFTEVEGYDGLVMLKRIPFESYCEHHIAPIIGYATIAYMPKDRVIGISKLARILDCFSKRLQVQEKMTAQIAEALDSELRPEGVAVIVTAEHHCMTTRGVHKHQSEMITSEMRGLFRDDPSLRAEIMSLHLGD